MEAKIGDEPILLKPRDSCKLYSHWTLPYCSIVFCLLGTKFISGNHINVLSKIDLISQYGDLGRVNWEIN